MVETPAVLPAPAIKVGGRRLSVSTKHKPSQPPDTTPPHAESPSDAASGITDYPRPAPPSTTNAHANPNPANDADPPPQRHHHHNTNDDPPKKERTEKKILGLEARKAEMTRPTRDNPSGKEHGIGMRIRQPSGKVLGV